MKFSLYIDTHSDQMRLALADGGDFFIQKSRYTGRKHSEQLLKRINTLLVMNKVSKKHIESIIVHTGPGSFTGLRIGITTANSLAYALSVPVVGVHAFEIIQFSVAYQFSETQQHNKQKYIILPGINDMIYGKGPEGLFTTSIVQFQKKLTPGSIIFSESRSLQTRLKLYRKSSFQIVTLRLQDFLKKIIHQRFLKKKKYFVLRNIVTPQYIASPNISNAQNK